MSQFVENIENIVDFEVADSTYHTDEMLMARFKQGDSSAFDEIYYRYKKKIFNYAYNFIGDPVQSEELVQELFLKVINSRDRYKPVAKFSTWIYTIGRNLCINQLKKNRYKRLVKIKGSLELTVAMTECDQEEQLHQRQLVDILRRATSELSPKQREVFLMREELKLPFSEIAQVLGCSENTVKSRMRYALKNLRAYLSKYYSFEDAVR